MVKITLLLITTIIEGGFIYQLLLGNCYKVELVISSLIIIFLINDLLEPKDFQKVVDK